MSENPGTNPHLPTPDEVVAPDADTDTEEGEKYQGGEIPRVEPEPENEEA